MNAVNTPVSIPQTLADFMRNPDAVQRVENVINSLLALRVMLTVPTQSGGGSQLIFGERNAQLSLGLRYPSGVPAAPPAYPAPTASSSYSQSEMQAVMNQLAAVTTCLIAIQSGEASIQAPTAQG